MGIVVKCVVVAVTVVESKTVKIEVGGIAKIVRVDIKVTVMV